jgi:hypothetical protein
MASCWGGLLLLRGVDPPSDKLLHVLTEEGG